MQTYGLALKIAAELDFKIKDKKSNNHTWEYFIRNDKQKLWLAGTKGLFFRLNQCHHLIICFDCDVTKILHHNHNKNQGCKLKKTKQKKKSIIVTEKLCYSTDWIFKIKVGRPNSLRKLRTHSLLSSAIPNDFWVVLFPMQ